MIKVLISMIGYKSVTVPRGKRSVSTVGNLSCFVAIYRKLNDLAKCEKNFVSKQKVIVDVEMLFTGFVLDGVH